MKLKEILSASRVVCGVRATSKKKAIEELSRILADSQAELGYDQVFSSLNGREKLGATGVGNGVAIPHGKVSGVEQSLAAFIRLENAVDYDASDGDPVDLLFGLLAPGNADASHCDQVAAVAEMFSDPANCEKLREAVDDASLHDLIILLDEKQAA